MDKKLKVLLTRKLSFNCNIGEQNLQILQLLIKKIVTQTQN